MRFGPTAFNSFTSLIAPWVRKKRIIFRSGLAALRIELDKRGKPSVLCRDSGTGQEVCLAGQAVILAGGPLNTPRLLLQSTSSEHPNGLGNSTGVLGRYLHDHPHVFFTFRLARPLPRLRHIAILSREPYESSSPLLASQVSLGARISRGDRFLSAVSRPSMELGGIVFGTMIPTPDDRVQLVDTLEGGLPNGQIDIHIRYSAGATETAERGVVRTAAIFDDAGLSPTITNQSTRLTPGSSVHYGGTARMHASPEFGVVDGFNALHDCPRVLVVDSSSFTTSVEKNPTLTAMAIAARAAARIATHGLGR